MSVSIGIVMELAAREMIAAKFKDVGPDHLFAALLKFSELPPPRPEGSDNTKDGVQEIVSDINALSQEIASRAIDSTTVRRAIRAAIGKGDVEYGGGPIHRSDSCRTLFDRAAALAESQRTDVLGPIHLLLVSFEDPTPAMVTVMGHIGQTAKRKREKTPLLDEAGEDLSQSNPDTTAKISQHYKVHTQALRSVLAQRNISCVFLASDEAEIIRSICAAAALEMAGMDCPQSIKGKRIIDVSRSDRSSSAQTDWVKQIIEEASRIQDSFVLLPPITSKLPQPDKWLSLLQSYLAPAKVCVICQISPSLYQEIVQRDLSWKRISHVIWLDKGSHETIPTSL